LIGILGRTTDPGGRRPDRSRPAAPPVIGTPRIDLARSGRRIVTRTA